MESSYASWGCSTGDNYETDTPTALLPQGYETTANCHMGSKLDHDHSAQRLQVCCRLDYGEVSPPFAIPRQCFRAQERQRDMDDSTSL